MSFLPPKHTFSHSVLKSKKTGSNYLELGRNLKFLFPCHVDMELANCDFRGESSHMGFLFFPSFKRDGCKIRLCEVAQSSSPALVL